MQMKFLIKKNTKQIKIEMQMIISRYKIQNYSKMLILQTFKKPQYQQACQKVIIKYKKKTKCNFFNNNKKNQ